MSEKALKKFFLLQNFFLFSSIYTEETKTKFSIFFFNCLIHFYIKHPINKILDKKRTDSNLLSMLNKR